MTDHKTLRRSERAAFTVSAALVAVAVLMSGASFLLWSVFHRDLSMTVRNTRGTALAIPV